MIVNNITVRTSCLPLCVTDCKMVRNVLKPTATSSKWAAKKKLLKFPKMENVKYHREYKNELSVIVTPDFHIWYRQSMLIILKKKRNKLPT